jgi:hypothetical protein
MSCIVIQATVDNRRSLVQIVRSFFIQKEVQDGPLVTRRPQLLVEEQLQNSALAHVRHSLGQRSKCRLAIDVLTRRNGSTVYKRLRKQTVYLSCATPEQLELAIESILAFAQSLDGKWLAPQPTDNTSTETSADDSQGNRSASAPGDSSSTAKDSSK